MDGKKRFELTAMLLLVSGFVVTSLFSYWVAQESVSEQITENTLPLTSDNVYSEIQKDLLRPVFISSLMAQDTFLRDWVLGGERGEEQIVRYLKEVQERYGAVTSFFVSEQTHNYYHSSGLLKKINESSEQDKWFFRVRKFPSDKNYEVNIDIDTADAGSTTVFVNYHVHDYAGRFIGVTGVGIAIDAVRHLVETYQQKFGRQVYFVDQQGNVTLHGYKFERAASIRQMPGLSKFATQLLSNPGSSFSYEQEGRTVYINSRLIPEFQWYLIVEQEEGPAEQRLINTLLGNLLISLVVTAVVLVLANFSIGRYQRRLEEMATTDKLTGASNRQFFEMFLEKTLLGAKRKNGDVSLIMLDLDHFKTINDTHGHLVGDKVLTAIVTLLREYARESDTLCRWGGEEFLLLLPDCSLQQALALAERIRIGIEGHEIMTRAGAFTVTASFGVAQFKAHEDAERLLSRIDAALYRAKNSGRNRVEPERDAG